MKATILDYGVGNLYSLRSGLLAAGFDVLVEKDVSDAPSEGVIVLPGVGAFATAAARILAQRAALRDRLLSGMPCLAICLGMQLLFDSSMEGPGVGIGLLSGTVARLSGRRVPHMGWNELETGDPLFRRSEMRSAWFAHSYICQPRDPGSVVAWVAHEGERFPAAVRSGYTLGVQFHPEKSSRAGISLLRAFRAEVAA